MKVKHIAGMWAVILGLSSATSCAATVVATYQFNNTFNADQVGAPAISPTDPLGASMFVTDVVLGSNRTVWAFDGTDFPPNLQAGLTIDTTGLVSPISYSVDMVFLFTEHQNNWRRIINANNRQTDSGFYVNDTNSLQFYPVSPSGAAWTNNVYHHLTFVNDGNVNGTTVTAYLDGASPLTYSSDLMNLNNANNPGLLLHFFLDNLVAGGQGDFSDGRVALIRLWSGVLSAADAQQLAANPFGPPAPSANFDHDNDVDGTDFLIWQRGYNLTGQTDNSHGDANFNGTVDGADLAIWESQYGTIMPLTAASTAVPEPASVVLVLMAGVTIATRAGRLRHG
jgi:Concanavalin A-like lectin/glucanases superfamily